MLSYKLRQGHLTSQLVPDAFVWFSFRSEQACYSRIQLFFAEWRNHKVIRHLRSCVHEFLAGKLRKDDQERRLSPIPLKPVKKRDRLFRVLDRMEDNQLGRAVQQRLRDELVPGLPLVACFGAQKTQAACFRRNCTVLDDQNFWQ